MSKFVKVLAIAVLMAGSAAHADPDKNGGTGQQSDIDLLKQCCKLGAKCDLNDPQMKKAMESFLQGQGITQPKPAK